ncbi:MAG: 4-(cytidine 5'-diphospho)-2-C-methyl-D-erythritol kinase [Paracoccaceae bacterium]
MAVREFAPAKVNLTLHVTGQRADGYHLLDSLVVFADVGDLVEVSAAPTLSMEISGPRSAGLRPDDDNLVIRAARFLNPRGAARIALTKNLPLSSGIGGGSSDAAASIRALCRLWDMPIPDAAGCVALGADVPVCLAPVPQRMAGVGEVVASLPPLPPAWLVLANPGVEVSTPAVFRALTDADKGGGMPALLPQFPDAVALAAFVKSQRNDLQAAACSLAPAIGECLDLLSSAAGCLVTRMSGSGATSFGLFESAAPAEAAAASLRDQRPGWWVAAAPILGAGS